MKDPALDFLRHAEPADYRHFLRDWGLACADLEAGSAGERVWEEDAAGAPVASGRVVALDWDTAFFGVPTGRLEGLFFSAGGGPELRRRLVRRLVARADRRGLVHLTCRVRADDLFLAQALEAEGFRLVDLMTVYSRDIGGATVTRPFSHDALWPLLARWLSGMTWGRLMHDARIDRATAERFYLQVSRYYLDRGAHLTMEYVDGAPVGAAIGVVDDEVSRLLGRRYGVLWLIIVAPEHQGRGTGARLFESFCREFGARCDLLEIGTQTCNTAANRLYLRAGCVPRAHLCTFHRWRDAA